MTDNLTISPMTAADVPQVHAIETTCFSAPWDIDAYYGELGNPTALYLVAHMDGRVVGFGGMWAVADEAHIVTLAVEPSLRRHGIGRLLVQRLIDAAHEQGVAIVTLEVRVSNTAAKNLYTSYGFRTIALRKKYYPDNNEDADIMALAL